MNFIKDYGVQFIFFLQNTDLKKYAFNLHRHLYFNTPVFAMTVLIPALLSFQGTAWGKGQTTISGVVAIQVIYALVWALRGNIFKQWVFGEDRPYWWVKEDPYFDGQKAPFLQQYPNTCLSSPASPFYPIVATVSSLFLAYHIAKFVRAVNFGSSFDSKKKWIVPSVWLLALLNIGTTGIAEIFFASHFPHQVLVALLIGLAAVIFISKMDLSKSSGLKKSVALNCGILGITIFTMIQRDAWVFNSFQKMAFKWCIKREWMQMDNAPFLDSFILTGYIIGTTAAISSKYFRKLNKSRFTPRMVFSLLIINLATTQFISMVADGVPKVPTTPHIYGWYASQLIASAMMPLFTATFVPFMVQSVCSVKPATSKAKKLT